MNNNPIHNVMQVNIELPVKLYQLISEMAKISNNELKTQLTAEDMISKLTVQYFGTRNSIDIMSFSLEKLPDLLADDKEDIIVLNNEFNETIIKLDELSQKVNKRFHSVIDKLETL